MNAKALLYAAVAAIVTLSSCTREAEESGLLNSGIEMEFTAEWADEKGADSRTVLQEDGTSIWWSANEEINVFIGEDVSAKFVSTNTQPQRLVSFVGNVLIGAAEQEDSFPGYWAVYPYNAENTCDGQSLTLSLPYIQKGKANGFADKFFPSVARSNNFMLSFWNVCGGARFSVTREGIKRIVFKSNDVSPMAGKVKVGFGEDNKPKILEFTEPVDSVVVNAPEGGFIPGTNYFAAMLPQTHAQGLSVTLYTATQRATKTLANAITVKRSVFGTLDNVDEGITDWADYKPEDPEEYEYYISFPDNTKAGLSGYTLVWKAGDKVFLGDGISSALCTVPSEYDGSTWAIVKTQRALTGKVYCIYPGEVVIPEESVFYVDVPEDQGIDGYAYMVCSGSSTSRDIVLSPHTAMLKVALNSDIQDLAFIKISAEGSPVSGRLKIGDEGDEVIPGTQSVIVAAHSDNDFYYSVLPGSITKLTLDIYKSDGSYCRKVSSGQYNIQASRLYTLNVPSTLTFQVDLGLSVKWASCNLGAAKPEEYGDYFAWGEIETDLNYDWSTYKWCMGSYNTMTKYCSKSDYGYNGFTDNKTVLDPEDDAAAVNLGGSWRMATYAEWDELKTKCTWTWTTRNGVNGRLITGPNGNSIFLPAAGRRSDTGLGYVGSYGGYWSSSLNTGSQYTACYVGFNSDVVVWSGSHRYSGLSVRPVTE